jgi:hypothetical protein
MSNSALQNLDTWNFHKNDQYLEFVEDEHRYFILNNSNINKIECISVSSWYAQYFNKFDEDAVITKMKSSRWYKPGHKYWELTDQEIKDLWEINRNNTASQGTDLHRRIEDFFSVPCARDSNHTQFLEIYLNSSERKADHMEDPEWLGFLNFVREHPNYIPYRSEWRIFNRRLRIAGTIDMMYKDPQTNTFIMVDWKRSKLIEKVSKFNNLSKIGGLYTLPDTNYWHYSLQLNSYRRILLDCYPSIKVSKMQLVQLHPDLEEDNKYKIWPIENLEINIMYLIALREQELEKDGISCIQTTK